MSLWWSLWEFMFCSFVWLIGVKLVLVLVCVLVISFVIIVEIVKIMFIVILIFIVIQWLGGGVLLVLVLVMVRLLGFVLASIFNAAVGDEISSWYTVYRRHGALSSIKMQQRYLGHSSGLCSGASRIFFYFSLCCSFFHHSKTPDGLIDRMPSGCSRHDFSRPRHPWYSHWGLNCCLKADWLGIPQTFTTTLRRIRVASA